MMRKDAVMIVDAFEVIKASHRFDIVFKVALAKAWAFGTPSEVREAEEAYLEMIRARNGFHGDFDDVPFRDKPGDFIAAFRKVADSIRAVGYDMSSPPIPVDDSLELLNGSHRLACCVAFGLKCPVVKSDVYPAGGSVLRTFLKGHIHPAVLNWGVRKYFELVPGGALAADFGDASRYPALPFPDWTRRNNSALVWKVKPALSCLWYSAMLPLKSGKSREKQLRRIEREKRKISGFAALAAYWRKRKDER